MSKTVYRYSFLEKVPVQSVEETLHLAVLSAENLHGQPRVRLDASYFFDAETRECVIEAGTDVGNDIVRLFTGFLIREFGEDAFQVRSVDITSTSKEKDK